jgi:hypothetical protein
MRKNVMESQKVTAILVNSKLMSATPNRSLLLKNHTPFLIVLSKLLSLFSDIRHSDGLRTGGAGFHTRQRPEIFLYSTMFEVTLEPTKPPIQWTPGALFPGIRRQQREADHSPSSSAEVKSVGATPPLSHTSSWHGAYLVEHGNKFTFTFTSD